ncbi:MAG: bifunctional UDP-N-acetylmuramoyl-tripeptide:D-alanyl-D-alanine ligase/alanine racemase [Bacteroidaceae bacterium]|nr:bifunctional UDP-N-acetylmuramoyl-tripeptide:D-alanyl-D-alanine ligase/alanine racemase [Bacteroidaceae bacterium]
MTYSISTIATLIGAHRIGTCEYGIDWLLTDSRSLTFPRETLFFAIRTQKNDGHRYIEELYSRGVRNFVVQQLPKQVASDANYLQVPSTLKAMQRLAERHREAIVSKAGSSDTQIPIIGITGSNGKTIVKEWLYQMLSPDMTITRSPRSWNSQIGVPLSVWKLSEQTQLGIFETGISEPGEMDALQAIIQPTIGVLTHLGSAHDENFANRHEKCMEKLRLFHDAQVLVYNADDEMIGQCIAEAKMRCELFGWSTSDPQAAVFITSAKHDNKTDLHVVLNSLPRQSASTPVQFDVTIPFIDTASIEDAIHCLCVSLYLGVQPATLTERMPRLEAIAMRLEVNEGIHGCTLITDSYNNDLNSLEIALDFMRRRPDIAGRKHVLILSDIKQTGLTLTTLYSQVAGLLQKQDVDEFIGIGAEVSAGMSCVPEETLSRISMHLFDTVEAFLRSEYFETLHDRVILLKGARMFRFDRINDALIKKVHETTLEINLSAVVDNLNHYRAMMQPGTRMVCMVKASAYGAGAVEIARTLQDHRVDYLAVAVADEGVELRRAGITANIMVMNPEMSSFRTLFEYQLEPEVYSFRLLDALIHAAEHEGITTYPIHIKLDTGMHRLGFNPAKDIKTLINRLQAQTALIPRSVFTHFVGADSDDFDAFSTRQWELFTQAADQLQSVFPSHILRHICNSAGIEHFPERQADMVRLGLGLYGIDARTDKMLTCISTLKTTILQIHDVPANETVGYSRRGILTRDSRIATLPIGYADGLNRHLGRGNGYCLVNGKPAPYVGNICMDVCMIDVTDIPCEEGDTAVIFGPDLPPTVLAKAIDTIPYEILTSVSPRVKRIYFVD